MIAFASLFLGLVFGVHQVEVVVGKEVAAVEIRLDGRELGVLRQAPWTLACDFGPELVPQFLEAVALDDAGFELGRASQWLNLATPWIETSVVLEPARAGEPRVARLSWESVAGAVPESVTATLDGEPLLVPDPHRIQLPPVDESELHILRVEVTFGDRVSSQRDVAFGGSYAEEVSTENTALAVRTLTKRRRPPSAAEMQGWFLKDGEPLRVITVEKGQAEVVVVMASSFPRFVETQYRAPHSTRHHRLRFVSPVPNRSTGVGASFDLFPVSPVFQAGSGNIYRVLTSVLPPPVEDSLAAGEEAEPPAEEDPPRFNAAVAVAGLTAYSGRRRRAVVILPGQEPDALTPLAPAEIRRYLERLAVPLLVWNPGGKTPEHFKAWGEVRRVGSLKLLTAAFDELTAVLDRQWIVWLDGRHLPQEITLSPQAEGFELLR